MVDGVDVLSNPGGVPNMVESLALMDDTVGLTLTKTLDSLVRGGGVTIPDDGVMVVGLRLFAIKDTIQVVVKVGPSIDMGGVTIPKVGLFGSKYGKGAGDALRLLGEGSEGN